VDFRFTGSHILDCRNYHINKTKMTNAKNISPEDNQLSLEEKGNEPRLSNQKKKLTARQKDIIGVAVIILTCVWLYFFLGFTQELKGQHKAALDQWEVSHMQIQETKRALLLQECESEKTGASLKLIAASHDEIVLSSGDFQRLADKKGMACDF